VEPHVDICAICAETEHTVYDHSYKTGRFRGWLCQRCKRVLWEVRDDVKILSEMVIYLEKDHGNTDNSGA
jgi:hypothetical protein